MEPQKICHIESARVRAFLFSYCPIWCEENRFSDRALARAANAFDRAERCCNRLSEAVAQLNSGAGQPRVEKGVLRPDVLGFDRRE